MFKEDAQKHEISCVQQGFTFDFCYKLKPSQKKLVVILPSAINREKYPTPPYFIRHRWFDNISHSVISVSDPMLYLNSEMTAGWMIGNENYDCLSLMLDLFKGDPVLSQYKESDTIFFGSSVGGFLALRAGCLWPNSTIVCDIPQIELFNHHPITYERCLKSCFPHLSQKAVEENFPTRISIIESIKHYGLPSHIWYLQNHDDDRHMKQHLQPFLSFIYSSDISRASDFELNLKIYRDSDAKGHSVLPKAKTLRVLNSL